MRRSYSEYGETATFDQSCSVGTLRGPDVFNVRFLRITALGAIRGESPQSALCVVGTSIVSKGSVQFQTKMGDIRGEIHHALQGADI